MQAKINEKCFTFDDRDYELIVDQYIPIEDNDVKEIFFTPTNAVGSALGVNEYIIEVSSDEPINRHLLDTILVAPFGVEDGLTAWATPYTKLPAEFATRLTRTGIVSDLIGYPTYKDSNLLFAGVNIQSTLPTIKSSISVPMNIFTRLFQGHFDTGDGSSPDTNFQYATGRLQALLDTINLGKLDVPALLLSNTSYGKYSISKHTSLSSFMMLGRRDANTAVHVRVWSKFLGDGEVVAEGGGGED